MKFFGLILALGFMPSFAFAFQEGTYRCSVDAFTDATIKLKSLNLNSMVRVPYVEYSYYRQGVTHYLKGIGYTDEQTVERRDKSSGERINVIEEIVFLPGVADKVISFNMGGVPSDNCFKR